MIKISKELIGRRVVTHGQITTVLDVEVFPSMSTVIITIEPIIVKDQEFPVVNIYPADVESIEYADVETQQELVR